MPGHIGGSFLPFCFSRHENSSGSSTAHGCCGHAQPSVSMMLPDKTQHASAHHVVKVVQGSVHNNNFGIHDEGSRKMYFGFLRVVELLEPESHLLLFRHVFD